MFYSTNYKTYSYHHRPTVRSRPRNFFHRHYRYSRKSFLSCSGQGHYNHARHFHLVKQGSVESTYRSSTLPFQEDFSILTRRLLGLSSDIIPNSSDHFNGYSNSNADTTVSTNVRTSVFKQYPLVLNDGRLPGGHPVCGDHSYSICSWYDDATLTYTTKFRSIHETNHPFFPIHLSSSSSCYLLSLDPRKSSGIPSSMLESLDMLNKLAYWFLFPIANDAEEIILCNSPESMDLLKDGFWKTTMMPLFQNFLKKFKSDILHVRGSYSSSDVEGLNRLHPQDDITSNGLNQNTEHDRHDSTHISSATPTSCVYDIMFSSISSIDSDEMRRQIEIESVARKLPVMTYDGDQDEDKNDSIKEPIHETMSLESYDSFERIPSVSFPPKISSSTSVEGLQWSWIAVPKDPMTTESMEHTQTITSMDNDFSEHIHREQNPTQHPLDQPQKCFICLESFQKGQKFQMLPCTHMFHTTCIDHWISSQHHSCFSGLCHLNGTHPILDDDDSIETMESLNLLNGEVPGICFSRLGGQLAKQG